MLIYSASSVSKVMPCKESCEGSGTSQNLYGTGSGEYGGYVGSLLLPIAVIHDICLSLASAGVAQFVISFTNSAVPETTGLRRDRD